MKFTVGVATINSDDSAFGEFQIWLDPCYAMVNPGHGGSFRFCGVCPVYGFANSYLIVSNGEIIDEREILWALYCN